MTSATIVVPMFNEKDNLPELIKRLVKASNEIFNTYQILIVDDGSVDGTLELIKNVAKNNTTIKYISLSRNFGHQAALRTGLSYCRSDVVITMDGDLQHPPECIPIMVSHWKAGYSVVNMTRAKERASKLKVWTSRLFYKLISAVSDINIPPGSSDFRLLDRRVVDVVNALPEKCTFLRGLIPWLGFRQIDVPYKVGNRLYGEGKYSVTKMIRLAGTGIVSTSTKPLRISFYIGAVTSILAVTYATYALYVRFILETAISGWTSLLIGVLLIGGVQLMMLGVLGEYLGRVFHEVKNRPHSIVQESNL